MKLILRLDDLQGAEIAAFLDEHLQDMRSVSPPESKHALDLAGLRRPEIRFWTLWDGALLVGCGALKELDASQGEVKSMRIHRAYRGKGLARLLLAHLEAEARRSGYLRLSLETGAMAFFSPARRLYEAAGFIRCSPFGSYREDPKSVFYTKTLLEGTPKNLAGLAVVEQSIASQGGRGEG